MEQVDRKELISLAMHLNQKKKLEPGMKVYLEAKAFHFTEATLVSWDTEKDEADPNNFGYYQRSTVVVSVGGKGEVYPVPMVMIKK